jgi:flagellar motor component MotA
MSLKRGEIMTKEEFKTESEAIKTRALAMAEKNRKKGIFSLENEIDRDKYYKRDIFDFGLWLITDGIDADIIDKILTNIVNLETDEDKKTLAAMKKKAILAIQAGEDPRW